MPPLPRKNKRTEAKVDDLVAAYLYKHHPRSFALEVKIQGGRVLDHQKKALRQVTNNTFKPYKISDMGRLNPFDYVCLKNADAILCVVNKKAVTCLVNEIYEIDFTI